MSELEKLQHGFRAEKRLSLDTTAPPTLTPTTLWDPNTMLPFPQTPTNPQESQHYIIVLQEPQPIPETPKHISIFIIPF